MSPAVWRTRWQVRSRVFGPLWPSTRAAFGRYVGSKGAVVTAVSAGEAAWTACYRERGLAGFRNRSWRRHYEPATVLGEGTELTAL